MKTERLFSSWLKEADDAGRKAAASVKRGRNEPCVFIWVTVFASAGAFYRWVKKAQGLQPHRQCGSTYVQLNIETEYRGSQELEYAMAYANVLQKHGVTAYQGGKFD
jgi:hypothetical protein